MKAIPTKYKGIQYRSKLEARWAVFFDTINFVFCYEPFTIESNGIEYVPDFWIPKGFENAKPVLVEIKPVAPNSEYLERLYKIHDPEKSDILICIGDPNLGQPMGIWIRGAKTREGTMKTVVEWGFACLRCSECGRFTINKFKDIQSQMGYTSCQRFHNIETSNNRYAAEVAKEYRFDLVVEQMML